MKQNISLKFRLIGLTMGLEVIPIAITSAVFLNELGQVIQMALEEAEKGITNRNYSPSSETDMFAGPF